MKTTRLGFYSTSEETASGFASVADEFAQSWYEIDCLVGSVEVLSKSPFRSKPESDDLIFFSTSATGNDLLKELNALADVCKPESQVYVFSPERDVFVYREILAMGVAGCESLPMDMEFITKAINGLLNTDGRGKLVLGASLLGVGFSTTLLNVASRCAYRIGADRSVSLVDGDNTAGITNLFITQSPKSFVQFDTGLSADPFQGSVLCDSAKYGKPSNFPHSRETYWFS